MYRKTTTGVDSLIVDNNGATSRDATMTRMPNNINLNSISNVVLNHKGVLGVIGNTTLDFSTFNPTTNGSAQSYLAIISDTNVTYGANWTIAGYTVRGEGISKTLTNVTIGNAGALSHRENGGTGTEPYKLNLTLVGNLTVLSNGAISAYAKGYSVQQGPGGCSANSWKGGAYGGGGGNANMNTYGSLLSPTNIGSGGNGGYGGGAILMNVIGTTTVATGGTIAANGENNGNGSGSGGTVNLTTGWLAGGGRIGADGGAGSGNGDGGGGRVAIVLTGAGANYSTWTGTNTAYGGASASYGAAGTVYQGTPGGAAGAGAVIVDNRNVATNVVFASLPAFAASNENLKKTSWTVQNKGKIGMTTNSFISSLTLNATSYLELSGQTLTLNALTITNKVYIAGTYTAAQLGGVLVTDGVGGGKIVLLTRGTAAFFR